MPNDLPIGGAKKQIKKMLRINAAGSAYNNFMLINQVGFHFVFEEFASDAIMFSGQTIRDPRYTEMLRKAYKSLRTDYIVISITKDPINEIKKFIHENPELESIQFSNLENIYPKEKMFSLIDIKGEDILLNGVIVINNDKIVENIRLSTDPNNFKLVLEIFPFLFDNQ